MVNISYTLKKFFLWIKNIIRSNYFYAFWGGLLGSIIFLLIYGSGTLNFTRVNWLLGSGDLTQHYFGWQFFRNDSWSFPLGVIRSLGYPYGTTITYTDSIPLFAIFFKIFRSILPENFQYFGLWTFMNFILQGLFAALLMNKISKNIVVTLISPLFFCMSNILILRVYIHSALTAQWIILFALYLYFLNKQERKYSYLWPLLFSIAIIVHPYLWLMAFIIFFGAVIERYLLDRNFNYIMVWSASGIFSTVFFMWIVGFFYGSYSLNVGGLGYYLANINTLVNPQIGWSVFLIPLPNAPNTSPGLNYLGLGMIILLITAVYSSLSQFKWITKEKLYENMGLLFIIPLCSVIALSNVVTFNNSVLFTYTLPGPLMKLWGIFQATERMVWPIFYLLMTFAIYQTSKGLGRNYKIALVLLFAFIIQYSDVAPRLQERHAIFSNPQDKVSPLKSAFWNDALKYYNSLVLLPLSMDNWEWITYYAVQNHLKINYSYMARVSKFIPEAANKKISLLESGHYQEGELYVIKDDSTLQRLCGAFHKSAFFANVDSEWVIAPNFNKTYADYPDITITGDNFSCDTYRLSDYLSKYKNQLIIISAKDDASGAIDEQTVIAFKRIGLSADLRGMLRKSYIGITYDGKPLYEAIVDYKVEFYAQKKQVINGFQMPFDIKVVSAGLLSGEQMAYININGVNYSLNKRGLNIVVYDPNINQVIDVSHFDTEQILTNYPVP